jgi:uncharacterized membrane protein YhaH (DUF805 family)
MSLRSLFSTSGRLAPLPFVVMVVLVYALSFCSQVLLSKPVTAKLNVLPFALVQAVLIWIWVALHVRRLRDAGRSSGIAIGIAGVYALEVVLLVIVVSLILAAAGTTADNPGGEPLILQLFVILYLLALLSGDPLLGSLQYWIFGIIGLFSLPVIIGVVYSAWAATRASAEPSS